MKVGIVMVLHTIGLNEEDQEMNVIGTEEDPEMNVTGIETGTEIDTHHLEGTYHQETEDHLHLEGTEMTGDEMREVSSPTTVKTISL